MSRRKKLKIILVAGARPNFMKISALVKEMRRFRHIEGFLVHTGQHYDDNMSASFFRDLELPEPDVNLEVGSGTHAWQTAEIMKRFEPVVMKERPSVVVVVGDVNSTVACSLVAVKLHVPVAHVEAGLRSFDRTMPEEVNRLLTDAMSDYLFTIDDVATQNLLREGVPRRRIFLVGDVMIDTMKEYKDVAAKRPIRKTLGLTADYGVLTLHRPGNVDQKQTLTRVLSTISRIARELPIVFPVHPRTHECVKRFGLRRFLRGVICTEPLGYVDFLGLVLGARVVLTDSGSIQQETYAAGVPCITLRQNTERPYTLKDGRNTLVGTDPDKTWKAFRRAIRLGNMPTKLPRRRASRRIIEVLLKSASC